MQKETGSILVHGPTVQTMGDCIGSGNKCAFNLQFW